MRHMTAMLASYLQGTGNVGPSRHTTRSALPVSLPLRARASTHTHAHTHTPLTTSPKTSCRIVRSALASLIITRRPKPRHCSMTWPRWYGTCGVSCRDMRTSRASASLDSDRPPTDATPWPAEGLATAAVISTVTSSWCEAAPFSGMRTNKCERAPYTVLRHSRAAQAHTHDLPSPAALPQYSTPSPQLLLRGGGGRRRAHTRRCARAQAVCKCVLQGAAECVCGNCETC